MVKRLTKREKAVQIGLKLTVKNHLRQVTEPFICHRCKCETIPPSWCYCEFAFRPLARPIDTGHFLISKIPVVVARYCLSCSRRVFPGSYKKSAGVVEIYNTQLLPGTIKEK